MREMKKRERKKRERENERDEKEGEEDEGVGWGACTGMRILMSTSGKEVQRAESCTC